MTVARRRMVGGILTSLLLIGAGVSAAALEGEWEYQLDAYYTALDYTIHLTTVPIPYVDNKSEWEIYKRLITSPRPRFLILEGSVNPLPMTGVYLKGHAPAFYRRTNIGSGQNIIQSVTAGFEEPAAVSIFLGNVIEFKPVKRRSYGEGKGYIGYLLSAGTQHIKDNELIDDNWIETEWKIKGDKKKSDIKLLWSFRVGAKFHDNPDIADALYISLRRSRVDYDDKRFEWLHNTGATYKFDVDARTFHPIQHQLVIDRKFPTKGRRAVPTLSFGFVYRTEDKYRGNLRTSEREFQALIQPNLEF